MSRLTTREKDDFAGYLRNCTDNQVRGCYEKERSAGRTAYVNLCKAEANRRGIEL